MKFWPDGTQFSINAQAVGGLDSIAGPGQTRGEVDLSDFDSGGNAEFTAGRKDNGTLELGGKYNPEDAGQAELETQYNGTGVPVPCVITLPTTAGTGPWTREFSGYVSAFSTDLSIDSAGTFSASVRVSGAVVTDNTP